MEKNQEDSQIEIEVKRLVRIYTSDEEDEQEEEEQIREYERLRKVT